MRRKYKSFFTKIGFWKLFF